MLYSREYSSVLLAMLHLQLAVFGLVLVFRGNGAVKNKEEMKCVEDCKIRSDLEGTKSVCKDTCNDKHLEELLKKGRQNTLPIQGKPTLVSSKYNSISLTWNTTSRITAVGYILKVNWSKPSVNEYFPYIKKYHWFNRTNQSVYTVEDLQSKTKYKFAVAVLLLNQTTVLGEWSDLIPTNNTCDKTTCGLTNFRIQLSSRVPDKGDEELNAIFYWEPMTESDLSVLLDPYKYIKIIILRLSTSDICRDYLREPKIETFGKNELNLTDKNSSFHKFVNREKKRMYFDCWYQVKIKIHYRSKEKTIGLWNIHLPECIEKPRICGCPYVSSSLDVDSVINLTFVLTSVNSKWHVIVSWGDAPWKNEVNVTYYLVTINEEGSEDSTEKKFVDSDIETHNYNVTFPDLKYKDEYTLKIHAYHSDHCEHGKRREYKFIVKDVCSNNSCSGNAICTRIGYFGKSECNCNHGYIFLNGSNGTCIDQYCGSNPCPVDETCDPKRLTETFGCNCIEGFKDVNGTCQALSLRCFSTSW